MPTLDEYLTINSVVLALDGAWEIIDPTPLLAEGPARGSNLTVADADGRTFRAKERDQLRVVLELDVFGEKDQAGTSHADYRSGMRDNIEYLRAQLLVANVGQVSCTYTFPDSATRTGNVEVLDLQPSTRGQIGNWTICALELVVPTGKLT